MCVNRDDVERAAEGREGVADGRSGPFVVVSLLRGIERKKKEGALRVPTQLPAPTPTDSLSRKRGRE